MIWNNYIFDPPFPQEYIIGLGIALAVLTVLTYSRSRGYAGWFKRYLLGTVRIVVIIALTIILLRPMRIEVQEVPTSKSVFQVLVDSSLSMNTEDMDNASRLTAVAKALKDSGKAFEELGESFDVEYYRFDEQLRSSTREELASMQIARGENTEITTSLLSAANADSSRKRAGILLVSDGRERNASDILNVASHLKSFNIPVWTTTVGTNAVAKDLHVTARIDENFIFVDHESELKVDIGQSGYDGWYAKVQLSRNGDAIAMRQVILNESVVQTSFPIQESESGLFQYTVEVLPLKGESDQNNNRRSVFAQVVGERSKILVIEAEPYWDSKFLLRTLQADPNLDVTSFYYMNRDKVFAVTQADDSNPNASKSLRLPKTKEELFRYDCVILGKGVDHIFTADEMKLFRSYVQDRGGNLVFARGRSYAIHDDVLSDLEPIVWEQGSVKDARFKLTASGINNPMFDFATVGRAETIIREMPEMINIAKVMEEKTLAIVLAKGSSGSQAEEIAAISYQRYGRGKVLSIGTSGLWRWAFSPKNISKYDPVYAKFWGQMIRWLVYGSDFLPGQDITFAADRHSFDLGDTVSLTIQTKQLDSKSYRPSIAITAPDGTLSTIRPQSTPESEGYYSVTFQPEKEGEYSAVLQNNIGVPETLEALFTVYNNSVETRYIAANPDSMDRIARITGGTALAFNDWRELPELVKEFEYSTKQESKPFDAWDRLLILFAVIGVLTLEWIGRRISGLV